MFADCNSSGKIYLVSVMKSTRNTIHTHEMFLIKYKHLFQFKFQLKFFKKISDSSPIIIPSLEGTNVIAHIDSVTLAK